MRLLADGRVALGCTSILIACLLACASAGPQSTPPVPVAKATEPGVPDPRTVEREPDQTISRDAPVESELEQLRAQLAASQEEAEDYRRELERSIVELLHLRAISRAVSD